MDMWSMVIVLLSHEILEHGCRDLSEVSAPSNTFLGKLGLNWKELYPNSATKLEGQGPKHEEQPKTMISPAPLNQWTQVSIHFWPNSICFTMLVCRWRCSPSSCVSVQALLNIPLFHMLLLSNFSSALWCQWKPNDLFMLMDFPCIACSVFSHSQLLLDVAQCSQITAVHAWVMALPAVLVLQAWWSYILKALSITSLRRSGMKHLSSLSALFTRRLQTCLYVDV